MERKLIVKMGKELGLREGAIFFFFFFGCIIGFYVLLGFRKKIRFKKKKNNANMETLKVKRKGSMCIDKPEILPVYA